MTSEARRELPVHRLPRTTPGGGFKWLDGIRVLDFTTSVAGPYATMLLADMGADVLKVERVGAGDDARHWGPPFLDGESLWFLSANRGKRSICLDVTSDEGQDIMHALVRTSDVLVCNLPRRAQVKLGLDAMSTRKLREDLVHVSITGFGLEGARADDVCYDLIAEGFSSIMDLTGEADREAQKVGTPAADMLAGTDAAYATLAALFDRERTGRGHTVDIALVDSMARFVSPRIVAYLGSGEVPRRSGAKDSVIAIYQSFETADEPMTLGLGNDNLWRRFWMAVGQPERGEDAATATNALRRERRAELVDEVQALLRTKTRDEWLGLFAQARIPAGPINRVDEVTRDAHLLERGLFYAIEDDERLIPQVGLGITMDGISPGPGLPPPRLGQHTDEVLGGRLGLDHQAIAALREKGIVA